MSSQEEAFMPQTEFEKKPSMTIQLLGNLSDFGIGNNETGIVSELADADATEKEAYGEKLIEAMRPITDKYHYGCIDGRMCLCNSDGSKAEIRQRQVGGTGALLEVAMNSNASILGSVEDMNDLPATINTLHNFYESVTEVKPSAHLGGCGGVNGAISHEVAITENPGIIGTVEALMGIPEILSFTELPFDTVDAQEVLMQAPQTAAWMKEKGWDGNAFVEGVQKDESAGVEDLEVDHNDPLHHGHTEAAVVFILNTGENKYSLSDETMTELGITAPFVVTLDTSFEMAKAFAGQQGEKGARKAFIANLAKHVAAANALADPRTPAYFMVAA